VSIRLFALLFSSILSPAGFAQDRVIQHYDDWGAYQTETGDFCWIATTPHASETLANSGVAKINRTGTYLMFSYNPDADPAFELSYAFGRDFPGGAAITLSTPLADISMFQQNGWAWIEQDDQMPLALKALQQAEILSRNVEIATNSGTFSALDTFSTTGLDAAMQGVIQTCMSELSGNPQRGLEN
jgi:hypothetical protein